MVALIYTMIALRCLNCAEIFLLTGNFGGINLSVKGIRDLEESVGLAKDLLDYKATELKNEKTKWLYDIRTSNRDWHHRYIGNHRHTQHDFLAQ
jgi:hypothetical protein